jgi:hypothetical protein
MTADFLRGVARRLGVDRAIFFTIIARGWSALAGPVTFLFVAHFLRPEEQGYYYTFGSILALQVFFELGLAYVIMQSVSHEKAHLDWTPDDARVVGDPVSKIRLASLLRLALKWYAVVAILVTAVLIPAGFWFFTSSPADGAAVAWRIPWLLLVALTALNLVVTPFVGVLEGCGKVSEMASIHARQAILGSLAVWIGLAAGLQLYVGPLVSFVSASVVIVTLLRRRRTFFGDLLKTEVPAGEGVSWRREILPFQWKISLSWLSGFFIFQLANPVLFRYHGAVEAGRMGMTMRIIESITALAFAWVSTKSAPFGSYIARREFGTLDVVFRKAALQSVAVMTLGGISVIALYHIAKAAGVFYVDRLVGPLALYFLVANAVVNCIIFSQAIYLRAHKQEPFLINSLIGAILIPAVMYFLGRPYGAVGISAGVLAAGLVVGLPLATWIFYKKRREWHQIGDA